MTMTSVTRRLLVGAGLLAPLATPVWAASINVGDQETVAAAGGTRPSPWQAGAFLQIGGELIVGAGGTVENDTAYLGTDFSNGATGSATVTGADALWANSGVLFVGDLSEGVLNIEDGGRVTALQTYIGSDLGPGQVTLSGAGSRLEGGNTLSVGQYGAGTLTLNAGTTATNGIGYLGFFQGSQGRAQVRGGRWENSGDLVVGSAGDGELTVTDGGTVISSGGFVGSQAGGQGRVTLDGPGARWEMGSSLVVGSYGSGEITVNAGGLLTNEFAFLGAEAGASGIVRVRGDDARWISNAAILVGSNGTGQVTIADGGTVRANGVVIGVNASGNGSLTLDQGGTLETPWVDRDAGTGAFYFNGGRLLAASDQDRLFLNFNDGDVVIQAGGAIIDSNGHDLTINTGLDGDGGLTKDGAGTLTLNGDNGFTGASRVDNGALIVNGALAGSIVTVGDGALLGGTGTLGGARLTDGATLAPGHSIGTLTVDGDLLFESGSVFQVEGSGDGDADRVHVTGTATLKGGSVAHIDAGGDYQPFTRYTLIDADQGVTGRFDQVSTNLAFLQPLLDYDSNSVILRLVRNDIRFSDLARTANQAATADAVEQQGGGDPLYDAVLPLAADGGDVPAAFDQLAGALHASTRAALIEDSRFLRDAVNRRLRDTTSALPADGGTVLGRNARSGAVVWTHAYGAWGEIDGAHGASGADRDSRGLFIGADLPVGPDWRAGALAGHGRLTLDEQDQAADARDDAYHLAVFAGGGHGAWRFSAGLGHSWHRIDTTRRVALGGFNDELRGEYDARTLQLFGEAGYAVRLGALTVEPFAGLARVRLSDEDHQEAGGAAALAGGGEDADTSFSTLGVRLATDARLAGLPARAHGGLGWRHAFGDSEPRVRQRFAGGQAFTVSGLPVTEDSAVLEAGLSLAISDAARVGLSYQGDLSDERREHGLDARFDWRF
ncbi:autotransporter domain-containing protein [Alloalcanivorax sp. C16-1]|uniref:autotransporter outer membrane beta-barrel domain-containing protein n=1 Tax=Alloalcanivorax sp. C16-1 TaxID=3390051 RepID=UPI003970E33D